MHLQRFFFSKSWLADSQYVMWHFAYYFEFKNITDIIRKLRIYSFHSWAKVTDNGRESHICDVLLSFSYLGLPEQPLPNGLVIMSNEHLGQMLSQRFIIRLVSWMMVQYPDSQFSSRVMLQSIPVVLSRICDLPVKQAQFV